MVDFFRNLHFKVPRLFQPKYQIGRSWHVESKKKFIFVRTVKDNVNCFECYVWLCHAMLHVMLCFAIDHGAHDVSSLCYVMPYVTCYCLLFLVSYYVLLCYINGSLLAKLKKRIPVMLLP